LLSNGKELQMAAVEDLRELEYSGLGMSLGMEIPKVAALRVAVGSYHS
jgi:hypothetical protein